MKQIKNPMAKPVLTIVLFLATGFFANAHAFLFFIPIPNLSKPAPLQKIIDAFENSSETRAVAFVSEDKTFGSKQWVWGTHSGAVTQEEANRIALAQCERNLQASKAQLAAGQPLYSYGDKKCELHPFTPNDGPKIAEVKKRAAEEEARRVAAEESAKRLAITEEARRLVAEQEAKRNSEEESRRLAAAEEAKRSATLEEAKRIAAEEEAKRAKASAVNKEREKSQEPLRASVAKGLAPGQIDFNHEASKSAQILGCQPKETKVTGIDGNRILYAIQCEDRNVLTLSCSPSGLCLRARSN